VALEVGLTFSASIPIAVLSVTIFKHLGRPSILENNTVKTVGSTGESIAAGVVYTMPALLLALFLFTLRSALLLEHHDPGTLFPPQPHSKEGEKKDRIGSGSLLLREDSQLAIRSSWRAEEACVS
jgi:hypothetical protein